MLFMILKIICKINLQLDFYSLLENLDKEL